MKHLKILLVLLLVGILVLSGCAKSPDKKEEKKEEVKEEAPKEEAPKEETPKEEAPKEAEGDEIIIGGLAPLTGPVATYGIAASNGAKMAFDEINKAGGVLGKPVKYLLEDEKGDQVEAVNAYHKLMEANIVAVLGDVTSGPTEAVASESVKDNMPMVTPTGTQWGLTQGRANMYRVCFTDPYQGQILAKLAQNLGAKSVAVVTNNSSDYSTGVAQAFVEAAQEAGIEVVAQESYGNTDTDFRAQLTKIKDKNPDVLLIPDYYEKIALIAPQAREVGITATFVGPDGWDGVIQQLDADKYNLVEGALFANHYALSDESEKVQTFVNNYKALYNEDPASFAALGYDAAYLLAAAIEKAGSTDRQAIIDALNSIEFDGVTGVMKFDENHNPVKSVSIIEIKNGEYTLNSVVSPE